MLQPIASQWSSTSRSQRSRLTASIDTASIDTVRELFETKRRPAVSRARRAQLHGRARPVELRASMISVSPHRVVVDAFARLSREAFGLRWSPAVELTSGVADFVDLTMRIGVVR